jgi:hypothetical protein
MKWLLGTCAQRFNARHRMRGHICSRVATSRCWWMLGLRVVCEYVHLNPVRAGLVAAEGELAGFGWSCSTRAASCVRLRRNGHTGPANRFAPTPFHPGRLRSISSPLRGSRGQQPRGAVGSLRGNAKGADKGGPHIDSFGFRCLGNKKTSRRGCRREVFGLCDYFFGIRAERRRRSHGSRRCWKRCRWR